MAGPVKLPGEQQPGDRSAAESLKIVDEAARLAVEFMRLVSCLDNDGCEGVITTAAALLKKNGLRPEMSVRSYEYSVSAGTVSIKIVTPAQRYSDMDSDIPF